jgi:hypothetical protein
MVLRTLDLVVSLAFHPALKHLSHLLVATDKFVGGAEG